METQDVSVATSATAVEVPVKEWTPDQRAHYLETMELPTSDAPAKSSDEVVAEAPSDESVSAQEAEENTGATEDSAPENPAPTQTRSQRRNENRYRHLADENNRLRTEMEQIKQRLDGRSKPEAQSEGTDDDPFPDASTMELGEWQKQLAQWQKRQVAKGVAAELAKQRTESEQKTTQAEQQKQLDTKVKKFAKGYTEYQKKLSEEERSAFDEEFTDVREYLQDNNLSHLDSAILESDSPYSMIRYLAKNWKTLESLASKPVNQALREFGRLEISEAVTGKAPKTITKAKPPNGSHVNGTGNSGSENERYEDAVRKGDFKTFTEMNKERNKRDSRFSW